MTSHKMSDLPPEFNDESARRLLLRMLRKSEGINKALREQIKSLNEALAAREMYIKQLEEDTTAKLAIKDRAIKNLGRRYGDANRLIETCMIDYPGE